MKRILKLFNRVFVSRAYNILGVMVFTCLLTISLVSVYRFYKVERSLHVPVGYNKVIEIAKSDLETKKFLTVNSKGFGECVPEAALVASPPGYVWRVEFATHIYG